MPMVHDLQTLKIHGLEFFVDPLLAESANSKEMFVYDKSGLFLIHNIDNGEEMLVFDHDGTLKARFYDENNE